MKILIVSATSFEVKPLLKNFEPVAEKEGFFSYIYQDRQIDVLVTGVGMTATAFYLGKFLNKSYDLAINIGVAGSFTKTLVLGQVINVQSDLFADLGAESEEGFLSLSEMNLLKPEQFPFEAGVLVNPVKFSNDVVAGIHPVNGITVNTVHGIESSIEKAIQKYGADVESMEGAAFLFACLMEDVPCLQIRAISNYVEKRKRESWKIDEAINAVCGKTLEIINSINE